MIKKILGLVFAICLILPCTFIMSACDDGITDCAYIQFVPANDDQVIRYSALMYSSSEAHISLYENQEAIDNNSSFGNNALLEIFFDRGFGIDYNIDTKETFVAEIEGWYSMEIHVNKEYYYTSQDPTVPKKVYLNGVDITAKADSTFSMPPREGSHALGSFWYDGVYYFEEFDLVKGNNSNYINKIELK